MNELRRIALEGYDTLIGLRCQRSRRLLRHEGFLWGQDGGRSSVDRRKQGTRCSTAIDWDGLLFGTVTAPANRHGSPLLSKILDSLEELSNSMTERVSVHLDRGYDSEATRKRLRERGQDTHVMRQEPLLARATNRLAPWLARADARPKASPALRKSATLTTAAKDVAGNALAEQKVWSFKVKK